jgi:hypothetical protein
MSKTSHPDFQLLDLEKRYMNIFHDRRMLRIRRDRLKSGTPAFAAIGGKIDAQTNRLVEVEAEIRRLSPRTEAGLWVKLLVAQHAMQGALMHPSDFDQLKWAAELAFEACWAADRIRGAEWKGQGEPPGGPRGEQGASLRLVQAG